MARLSNYDLFSRPPLFACADWATELQLWTVRATLQPYSKNKIEKSLVDAHIFKIILLLDLLSVLSALPSPRMFCLLLSLLQGYPPPSLPSRKITVSMPSNKRGRAPSDTDEDRDPKHTRYAATNFDVLR